MNGVIQCLFSKEQYAAEVGMTVASVTKWIELGKLQTIKVGRRVFILDDPKIPERQKPGPKPKTIGG